MGKFKFLVQDYYILERVVEIEAENFEEGEDLARNSEYDGLDIPIDFAYCEVYPIDEKGELKNDD